MQRLTPLILESTMRLQAIILTYNEAAHIEACIASLKWADAVLVFDSFSTDDTLSRAERLGAQVIQHRFVNYSVQRQAALDAADADWVYFVDADERSSLAQAEEIRRCIADPAYDAYGVPRHNYIFGKLTKHAGWYPDYQVRLLRRDAVKYDMRRDVHEVVLVAAERCSTLTTPLIHENYRDVAQFIAKQERYTTLAAEELARQGVRVKPQNYILQPLRQFIWRFITLAGYKDGFHGLRLSALLAWYELQKYVRLARLQRGS
jgi:glycosyltransferase involved in cell wall biosynthesis